MRGPLTDIIPAELDAGPATQAVRAILEEWTAIDWFVPPGASAQLAQQRFTEHIAIARHHNAKAYPDPVGIEFSTGSWPDFAALCSRVRSNSAWDWKFRALKLLSHEHKQAHGWTLQSESSVPSADPYGLGSLFYRFGNHIIWKSFEPKLDFSMLSNEHAECARFYLSYAAGDATDAVQWLLAEPHSSFAENPFVPLVRCYAAGSYPFALSPTSVVLFRFHAPS